VIGGAGRSFSSMGRLVAACMLACLAGAVRADPAAELASSPAQRCLSPAADDRVKPVYPPKLYDMKIGGTIEAEFTFTGPDTRPRVRIEGEPRQEFADAIEEYARQLRVPCMGADDAFVRLRQSFVFMPNDGRKVAWTTPVDTADAAREEQMKCLVKPSPDLIRYPTAMLRLAREGTVLARVRFTSPAAAPGVDVLYNGGDPSFAEAISDYVAQLRLPCLAGAPLEEDYDFAFRIEGGGNLKRHVLTDQPLRNFLGAVKPIKPGSVFFDTNTMKCPFDVRLRFRQPVESNRIEELDEDVPARHAFLDWLGEREINLDRKMAGELYGQTMTIHIPCARIDL
jgi:hypothetical protein